jgi:hypothetical protein
VRSEKGEGIWIPHQVRNDRCGIDSIRGRSLDCAPILAIARMGAALGMTVGGFTSFEMTLIDEVNPSWKDLSSDFFK